MFDGSRQSDIFTANVSGIGPAARIAISDVALDRASLDEVKVVTAHEAGHYVLGHVWRHILVLPLLARSEEHTSELQSLMRSSYAVFCLKKKTTIIPQIILI